MKRVLLIIQLILILILEGCSLIPSPDKVNGIYYWRTTYDPSTEEKWFLNEHEIRRMYIRFFDVVIDDKKNIVPNATIQFNQNPSNDLEYVPTVFITNEAMLAMKGKEGDYAHLITKRVHAMMMKNKIEKVHEVQLDCDWTTTSQNAFFILCDSIKNILHPKGFQLSSTIRLHQLRQEKPPVDKGVLMVYNTGAIKNPSTYNSILDISDVKHYLKGIKTQIPMDFAFPVFSWSIWFQDDNFVAIIRHTDLSNSDLYEDLGNNRYRVLKSHNLEGHYIYEGDIFRLERPRYSDIMKVKEVVEKAFHTDGRQHSVILYHLDNSNLSKYSSNEIENLYHSSH